MSACLTTVKTEAIHGGSDTVGGTGLLSTDLEAMDEGWVWKAFDCHRIREAEATILKDPQSRGAPLDVLER